MKERAGVKQLRRGKNLETLTNPWVDSSFSPYLFHGLSSYRFSVSRFGLIPETTVRGRQPPLSFQKNRIVGEGTIRKRPERLGWTLITATLNSRRWVVEKKKKKKDAFPRDYHPSRDRLSRYNAMPCLFLVFERVFKHSSWINQRFASDWTRIERNRAC